MIDGIVISRSWPKNHFGVAHLGTPMRGPWDPINRLSLPDPENIPVLNAGAVAEIAMVDFVEAHRGSFSSIY